MSRLSARVAALEVRNRPVGRSFMILRADDETPEEAIARHQAEHPEDRDCRIFALTQTELDL